MGVYRFAVYAKKQIGFMVSYDYGFIILDLPFLKLMLTLRCFAMWRFQGTSL